MYRVNYNEENWEFLSKTLADEKLYDTINPLNRAQIIMDIFGLAWIGKMKYEVACTRIQYLKHEVEYLPWNAAIENLIDLDNMLMRTDIYNNFKVTLLTPDSDKNYKLHSTSQKERILITVKPLCFCFIAILQKIVGRPFPKIGKFRRTAERFERNTIEGTNH